MSMKELEGKVIVSIWQNVPTDEAWEGRYLGFICGDRSMVCYQAVGDCCANAYFYQLDGAQELVGQLVTEVQMSDVETDDGPGCPALDTHWYRFQTPKGETLVVEFRTEHNGYYSGWAEPCKWPDVAFRAIAVASPRPPAAHRRTP